MHKAFHIPPSWWELCIWWRKNCKGSKHGSAKWTGAENRLAMRISWMELAVALQIRTGFKLPGHTLDLANQEKVFVLRILKLCKFNVDNVNAEFKDACTGPINVGSTSVIIGHSRTGICRRPMLDNGTCNIIVNISDALRYNNTRDTFEVGHRVTIPSTRIRTWQACILSWYLPCCESQATLARSHEATRCAH